METQRSSRRSRHRFVGLAGLGLALGSAGCGDRAVEITEARSVAGSEATPDAPAEEPPGPSRRELPGGLVVDTRDPGRGPAAANGDLVSIHYTGFLAESGEPFESTRSSGIPFVFALGAGEVLRGLDRGLVGARRGARIELEVPAAQAYGERGLGNVPPGADLRFEIQVIKIDPR